MPWVRVPPSEEWQHVEAADMEGADLVARPFASVVPDELWDRVQAANARRDWDALQEARRRQAALPRNRAERRAAQARSR